MGEELNLSCHNDTERFNKIKSELSSLKDLISKTLDKVCVPIDQAGYFEKLLIDIDEKFNEIFDYIERLNVISKTLEIEIENLISLSGEEIKNISDFNHFKAFILEFKVKILVLARSVLKDFQIQTYKDYKGKSEELVDVLKSKEEMLSLKINQSSEGVIRSISSLINVIDAISFKLTIDRTRMSFNEFSKFSG